MLDNLYLGAIVSSEIITKNINGLKLGTQSCLTLPDCRLPGLSVHEISNEDTSS